MLNRLRRLLPGIALIVAASAALVLTDRSGSRNAATPTGPGTVTASKHARIAVIQYANIAAFEMAKKGLLRHLASIGYSQEAGSTIDVFNAEGDNGTLSQVCTQVATSAMPYDLAISLGTAATQSFNRANKRALTQAFGLVASPPTIGIPLGPYTEGSTRPKNSAGSGTLQPVDGLFDHVMAIAPGLKRVGVVWNPAEANSEANVKLGRAAAKRLGFELIEANGSNVSEVTSAAEVVLARGVEAYWILADVSVNSAAPGIIERCRKARVPVVTNFPEFAAKGAAFNEGADWDAIGITAGIYAELLLGGVEPKSLPVENFVPSRITINLDGIPASWKLSDAIRTSASEIHESGKAPIVKAVTFPAAPESALAALAALHAQSASGSGTSDAPAARAPTIAILTYNRTPNFESCYAGFAAEWARLGYVDGKNCNVTLRDAQFDTGSLNTIAAAIDEDQPDVVVPFTTPALQAAMRRVKTSPIVFSLVASGVDVGAGTSNTDHLPNITGAQVGADWDKMIEVARAAIPNLRRVGTVFSPGESNSVMFRDQWKAKLAAVGIELVSTGAEKPTELPEAADALVTMGIQAVLQISDNSSSTGFRVIAKAADRANIPVFGFSPSSVQFGATLTVSRDFADVGRLSAQIVDRVLHGESPAKIPFRDPDRTVIIVNTERLQRFGITLPKAIMDQATIAPETQEASK